jgi:2-dehydropantoate 2-reductase
MGLEDEWGKSWKERVEPAVLTAGFSIRNNNSVETTEGDLIVSSEGRALELFQESSLKLIITEDMETVRWSKWLVNSVINPLGALSGLRNNRLLEAGLGEIADNLFNELIPMIPADLRSTAAEKAKGMLDFLLRSSSNRCSMLQDVLAGRRTEIDFLTGLHEKQLRDKCPAAASVTALVRALTPSRLR